MILKVHRHRSGGATNDVFPRPLPLSLCLVGGKALEKVVLDPGRDEMADVAAHATDLLDQAR